LKEEMIRNIERKAQCACAYEVREHKGEYCSFCEDIILFRLGVKGFDVPRIYLPAAPTPPPFPSKEWLLPVKRPVVEEKAEEEETGGRRIPPWVRWGQIFKNIYAKGATVKNILIVIREVPAFMYDEGYPKGLFVRDSTVHLGDLFEWMYEKGIDEKNFANAVWKMVDDETRQWLLRH